MDLLEAIAQRPNASPNTITLIGSRIEEQMNF